MNDEGRHEAGHRHLPDRDEVDRERSTKSERTTPLQGFILRLGALLDEARGELTASEYDVLVDVMAARVVIEAARGLDREWRDAA